MRSFVRDRSAWQNAGVNEGGVSICDGAQEAVVSTQLV